MTSPNTRSTPADKQTEDTAVPVADWVDLTGRSYQTPDIRRDTVTSRRAQTLSAKKNVPIGSPPAALPGQHSNRTASRRIRPASTRR